MQQARPIHHEGSRSRTPELIRQQIQGGDVTAARHDFDTSPGKIGFENSPTVQRVCNAVIWFIVILPFILGAVAFLRRSLGS
jgi:hypothetical protein